MDSSRVRNEYKFSLNGELVASFCTELASYLPFDREGGEEGTQIRSDYFDDEAQSKYWEKKLGAPSRRRVRTRTYTSPSNEFAPTSFIEIKHKLGEDSAKRRVLISSEELDDFRASHQLPKREDPSAQKILAEVASLLASPTCQPRVSIHYHRCAFDEGPTSRLRVTLDTDLTCRFFEEEGASEPIKLLEPGQVIMEVKVIGAVPYWFRQIIGKYGLVPQSYSKFIAALDERNQSLSPAFS